ncbi:hypothetical protein C8J56DRAFT_769131, partial [Mycena floridula]
ALGEYSQRSDCFRRAAGLIRVRCSQLEMDEEERVGAAISMTLCELATAKHHTPPLECNSVNNVDEQSICVGALARSAQFWSSYSGYLREIPQLCFALRRWDDIDAARELYRNATLEKISLLQLLVHREKTEGAAWTQRLAVSVIHVGLHLCLTCNQELQDVASHIRSVSTNVAHAMSEDFTSTLRRDFDQVRHNNPFRFDSNIASRCLTLFPTP